MRKSLNIFIALASFLLLTSPAFAISSNAEKVSLRCTVVTSRVDLLTSKYDTNKQRHVQRFQRITEKVQELITKLESKGYDLTKLKNDVTQLENMKKEFAQEYTLFITGLKNSKTYACGNSDGQFKTTVAEARTHLTKSRELSSQIRVFIVDTIKPDLKDLLTQVREKKNN